MEINDDSVVANETTAEVHAKRIMRSDAARKTRKEVKSILEKKTKKEIEEQQHLLEKHRVLMKQKKNEKGQGETKCVILTLVMYF